jgi:hypothetical protein
LPSRIFRAGINISKRDLTWVSRSITGNESNNSWNFNDSSDEEENANDSIRFNREVDSNEIDERVHNLKNRMIREFQHSVELKLIQVMKFENADDSIRVNREFDSNEIDESD